MAFYNTIKFITKTFGQNLFIIKCVNRCSESERFLIIKIIIIRCNVQTRKLYKMRLIVIDSNHAPLEI